jgi:hypothetical protein
LYLNNTLELNKNTMLSLLPSGGWLLLIHKEGALSTTTLG